MPAMSALPETEDGEYDHEFRADPEKRKAAVVFDHVLGRVEADGVSQERKREWREQRG